MKRIIALFAVLCWGYLVVWWVPSVQASDAFWFWKNGSINATSDITIWWMNGDGTIQREDALLDIIKWGVNWVLWILALVALAFVLFGWIKIATARWEEWWFNDGMKIIQRALLGLLIIGVAWFIISAIFWLLRLSGEASVWGSALTDE